MSRRGGRCADKTVHDGRTTKGHGTTPPLRLTRRGERVVEAALGLAVAVLAVVALYSAIYAAVWAAGR